jgi:hypothetical protein
VSAYNYDQFDAYVLTGAEAKEFEDFPNMLHAGERAPGGELTMLGSGETVTLQDRWRKGGLVVEFGSFT